MSFLTNDYLDASEVLTEILKDSMIQSLKREIIELQKSVSNLNKELYSQSSAIEYYTADISRLNMQITDLIKQNAELIKAYEPRQR